MVQGIGRPFEIYSQTGYSFDGNIANVPRKFGILVNPLLPKSDLWILLCLTPVDFTLSNARRFYSSKGGPLGLEGLNSYLL